MINEYGGSSRARPVFRGAAPRRRTLGGLQDQHRHRRPDGGHRHHPQGVHGEPQGVRPAQVPRPARKELMEVIKHKNTNVLGRREVLGAAISDQLSAVSDNRAGACQQTGMPPLHLIPIPKPFVRPMTCSFPIPGALTLHWHSITIRARSHHANHGDRVVRVRCRPYCQTWGDTGGSRGGLSANPVWRRGRTHPPTGRTSLIALGQTETGRFLFIVLSRGNSDAPGA